MPMRCEKIKHNEVQCKAYAMFQSRFCFWHCPKAEEKRNEARKKGGLNRRKDYGGIIINYKIKSYRDIQQLLEIVINKLMKGDCTPREARAIGYLCNLARNLRDVAHWESIDYPGSGQEQTHPQN